MPKLNTFDVVIRTGARGPGAAPKWSINGFVVDFEQSKGGTGPGETFEGTANPGSFPHTLLIRGPELGAWDIEEARITYFTQGDQPYAVRLGAVTLDADADLNIWYERPQKVFDV